MAELLKKREQFAITGITRDTSSYTAPADSGIIQKKVDYESFDSLVEAFSGQDAVVNCITGSATQYDPSKRIIDACVAANVKFFFANEFVGHVTREQYRRLPEAFVGGKYRIRQYMEELGKEGKIVWTSLTGGPFFDMCKSNIAACAVNESAILTRYRGRQRPGRLRYRQSPRPHLRHG